MLGYKPPVGRCMKPSKTKLGTSLRVRRLAQGRSQAKVAELAGTNATTYHHIERGVVLFPFSKTLQSIARVFTCRASKLAALVPQRDTAMWVKLHPTQSILGKLIRAQRKKFRLSQPQLARKIGTNRQTISYVESGQIRLNQKNAKCLKRLAIFLKMDIAELRAVLPKRKLKCPEAQATTLGGFLATRRVERHLTQREVARRAKMPAAYISLAENNKKHLRPENLERIVRVLGSASSA